MCVESVESALGFYNPKILKTLRALESHKILESTALVY